MGEIKNLVDQSIKQREDALRHSNSLDHRAEQVVETVHDHEIGTQYAEMYKENEQAMHRNEAARAAREAASSMN